MDFTTTVLLSCFYVVLASHIWVQRERVSSIPSKVWQILSSWRNHFSCTDEVSKLEACVQQEMNETRVRNFQKVLAFGATAYAGVLLLFSLFVVLAGLRLTGNQQLFFVTCLLQYLGCLIFMHTSAQVTVRKIHLMGAFFTVMMVSRTLIYQNAPYFFLNGGLRLGLRVLFGLLCLDYRRSFLLNSAVSFAVCWGYSSNYEVFPLERLMPYHQVGFCVVELVQLCTGTMAGRVHSPRDGSSSRLRLFFCYPPC